MFPGQLKASIIHGPYLALHHLSCASCSAFDPSHPHPVLRLVLAWFGAQEEPLATFCLVVMKVDEVRGMEKGRATGGRDQDRAWGATWMNYSVVSF